MTDEPVTPRDAATVIVARDANDALEVYMVRRSAESKAFPEAYVFPGGTVDQDDYAPEAQARLAGRLRPDEPAITYAAIRETFEECGLLFAVEPVDAVRLRAARRALLAGGSSFAAIVAKLDVRLDAGALHYFFRRVTGPAQPYRFDARFFVARAPAEQVAEVDAFETHDGAWVQPAAIIAASERDEVQVLRPTMMCLERLRSFADVEALLAYAGALAEIPGEMGPS